MQNKYSFKTFLLSPLLLCILFLLNSCWIRVQNDLTHSSSVEPVIYKCLELKQNVFLVKSSQENIYLLKPTGLEKGKVIDMIPIGTRLRINNAFYRQNTESGRPYFYATIDDARYSHLTVDVVFLLDFINVNKNVNLDDRYLQFCED